MPHFSGVPSQTTGYKSHGASTSDTLNYINPVHQLFPLDGDTCEADVDVVFFHGLQQRPGDQSWKTNWVQRGKPGVCWPQEWLPGDLDGRVRVLSLEYDAQIMEFGGRGNAEDVHDIGSNLRHTLVNSLRWKLGSRPVVLVGHSFGGLVIKSLVVEVHKASMREASGNALETDSILSAKAFLGGLRGIVFYGVPHGGANIGEIYKSWRVKGGVRMAGIVKNLEPFQRKMELLSTEFDEVVLCKSLILYAFGEGRPMEEGRSLVVEYASAERLSRHNNYKVEDANHFEVCQPPDNLHFSYEKLVYIVRHCINEALHGGTNHLPERKFVVGLEPLVKKVMEMLQLEEPRGVQANLGVVGMGGLGKTTLIEEVYKRIRTTFFAHYFLMDVRERSKRLDGLVELQSELLRCLCKYKGKIQNVHQGKAIIRQLVTNLKVLVVLDDVDREDQLDAFLVNEKIFGEGNRVIVTSRSSDVLRQHDKSICTFGMEGLGLDNAMELFCWRAFQANVPTHGHEEMAKEVVVACDGLPLSLEVMGACLRTKASNWQEVLRKLKEAKDMDGGQSKDSRLWGRLKISLDTLGRAEKDVFLDIVCFFNKNKNVRSHTAEHIWGSTLELLNLIGRSLVKINEEDQLVVHDQLRDLGRKMVEEESLDFPSERSRLWDVAVANEAFASKRLSPNVRGLALEGPQEEHSIIHVHEDLPILKLLTLTNVSQTFQRILDCHPRFLKWLVIEEFGQEFGEGLQAIPSLIVQLLNLKVLRVEGCQDLKEVPESLGKLRALHELDMVGLRIERLPTSLGSLTNLTSLDLPWCRSLTALPKSVGQLTNLISLDLRGCGSLAALPESIGQLTNLTSLDLSRCESLAALPKSIGQLTNLTHLGLSKCESLAALPKSVGQLTNLTSLDLSQCESLAALPESVGQLTNFTSLDLSQCESLAALPESVGQLTSLTHISLSKCGSLTALPKSVGQLTNLTHLGLFECGSFTALSELVGQLTNLTHLGLSECGSLITLPESVGQLTNLTYLGLSECRNLIALPEWIGQLTNLTHLGLSECRSLTALPESVGQLTNLAVLDLSWCRSLAALPEWVGQLTNLVDLNLSWCRNLAALSEWVGQLTKLVFLDLSGWEGLAALPKSVGQLTNLTYLRLSECRTLAALPESVGQLTNLTSLRLSGCGSLTALPQSVGQMINLISLDLSSCESLAALPESVGQLTNLTSLGLSRCGSLAVLPRSVGQLTNLTSLDLSGCGSFVALPEWVGQLTNLASLGLSGCGSLAALPESVGQLTNLVFLDLSGWGGLTALPEWVGQLTNLFFLDLSGWGGLAALSESVGQLTNLTSLNLSKCGSLAALPESVGQLTKLASLDVSECGSLANLPESVGHLTNLTSLNLSGCGSLASLPKSVGQLTNLISLDLSGCESLAALPESIRQLTNLASLDLSRCGNLAALSKLVGQLTNLTSLNLSRCGSPANPVRIGRAIDESYLSRFARVWESCSPWCCGR